MDTIRIATRKSPLALWQAEHIAGLLRVKYPEIQVELVPVVTEGDRRLEVALSEIGGKGLFLKELEQYLFRGDADIAVHSMKDVPAVLADGLEIVAVSARADPGDAFVSREYASLDAVPQGAVVGTSSTRRRALMLRQRPDLRVENLRGNVATRLSKLDGGEYQAILLAVSGLERLGLGDRIRQRLDTDTFLPAIGQGVVGVECLSDNLPCRSIVSGINHMKSWFCLLAERGCGLKLEADCHMPLAIYAYFTEEKKIHLRALVSNGDGTQILFEEGWAEFPQAVELGQEVADRLLARGAASVLAV